MEIESTLQLLKKLVNISSTTGEERALAEFCESYLQTCGFKTQRQMVGAGRFNVLAEKGQGEKTLLLYAHLDTVPPDSTWDGDPLVLRQEENIVYGLGTSDMKGGIAVILKAVEQLPTDLPFCLKVALCVDEEGLSQGVTELVESPWSQDVHAAVVPELGVVSEVEQLVLGRRGHYSFRVTIHGQKVHGAVAHEGLNAIEEACRAILALKAFSFKQDPVFGKEGMLIRSIKAEQKGLSVPDRCIFLLHYFPHPERTEEDIQQELEEFLKEHIEALFDIYLFWRPTPHPMGYWVEESNPFVEYVQGISQKVLGHSLSTVYAPSVADENLLFQELKIPILSIAPLGGKSHQVDEWCDLDSIERLIALYREIIQNYVNNS